MKANPTQTLIFILASATNIFAQTSSTEKIALQGKILEKATDLPLAYVSVGVQNKSHGTVSDSLGRFSFTITGENLADTLLFSLVGYNSSKITVKDFISNPDKSLHLTVNPVQLDAVIVSSPTPGKTTEAIGRQGSGKLVQISIHNKTSVQETIGSEMGMGYKAKKPGGMLMDFNYYISANNFNYIKFRINIYSLKDGMPDTLTNNKQIFSTIGNFKTGWTKVDLSPFQIKVDNEFVVTLQWIESTMDKQEKPVTIVPVALTPFSKRCFVRIASQDKWIRKGMNLSNFVTIAY